jgi:hypothetical protein
VILGVRPTETQLQVCEEAVVRSVRAYPEPGDLVIVQKPKGAVSRRDASGVDGVATVNLLELGLGGARSRGTADTPFERLP